jgi:hypothetical protein
LRLGMSQHAALAALSKEFDPKQVSISEGHYILWTGPDTPLRQSAGSVWFKDGKLYRASKTWGETPTTRDGTNATDGLFAVLAGMAGRTGRLGNVKAETLRAPGSPGIRGTQVQLVSFEFPPDRVVRLTISTDIPGTGSVLDKTEIVDEILVELPVRK